MGTSGTVGATVGYNNGMILGANTNLTHRSKQLNTFLNYSFRYDDKTEQWNVYHEQIVDGFIQPTRNENHRQPIILNHYLQGGVECQLTGSTTVNILLGGAIRDWDTNDRTYATSIRSQDSSVITDMAIHEVNKLKSASGSVGIAQQLDDNNKLEVIYDFLGYNHNNPSQYDNQMVVNGNKNTETILIDVSKKTPMRFHVGSLDYSGVMGTNLNIEVGAKVIFSHFNNNVVVREGQEINPDFTNAAILDENYQAGYVNLGWELGAAWNTQFGLRYEHTDTDMYTPNGEALVKRNYGNWFPSFFAKYTLSKVNSLSISYSRRITRPTFSDLAPFVFFIGPTTFIEGNVTMQPAISDNVDINFQHESLWFTLKYSYANNEFAHWQLQESITNEYQIFRTENLDYLQTYGANLTIPFHIRDWWEIQANLEYYRYQYLTRHLEINSRKYVNSCVVSLLNTLTLPKAFTLSLSGYLRIGDFWGTNHMEPYGQVDLGISKKFNNGSTLALIGTDLFATYVWRFNSEITNSKVHEVYEMRIRSVNLTFSLPFGNKKLKSVEIKSGADEEKSRVN